MNRLWYLQRSFSVSVVGSNQLLSLGLILNAEMTIRSDLFSYQNSYMQKPGKIYHFTLLIEIIRCDCYVGRLYLVKLSAMNIELISMHSILRLVLYLLRPPMSISSTIFSQSTIDYLSSFLKVSFIRLLMFDLFPSCPLSRSNSSYGSSDLNIDVPSSDIAPQPRDLSLLDGNRGHHHSQPNSAQYPSYSNAVKFSIGSHGGSQIPMPELEFCPQPFKDSP